MKGAEPERGSGSRELFAEAPSVRAAAQTRSAIQFGGGRGDARAPPALGPVGYDRTLQFPGEETFKIPTRALLCSRDSVAHWWLSMEFHGTAQWTCP